MRELPCAPRFQGSEVLQGKGPSSFRRQGMRGMPHRRKEVREKIMDSRSKKAFAFLVIVSLFLVAQGFSQDKFKLKPGAKGKLCLNCHDKVADALKLPYVHTPVKAGNCSDCHNPHDSAHGKLLEADPTRICNKCHGGIVPEQAKSTHKVVAEGNCIKCHDPHAARNKNNLLLAGNELCLSCHKDLAKAVSGFQFRHNPVVKGCTTCHNPHASSASGSRPFARSAMFPRLHRSPGST